MHKIDISQISFFHRALVSVLFDIEINFGSQIITSLYRRGDSGIHETIPLRAIDIGFLDGEKGKLIEDTINRHFQYDPDRIQMKCAIWHDVGRGPHLHIQVHPNTRRK